MAESDHDAPAAALQAIDSSVFSRWVVRHPVWWGVVAGVAVVGVGHSVGGVPLGVASPVGIAFGLINTVLWSSFGPGPNWRAKQLGFEHAESETHAFKHAVSMVLAMVAGLSIIAVGLHVHHPVDDPLRVANHGEVSVLLSSDCKHVTIITGELTVRSTEEIPSSWRGQRHTGDLVITERSGERVVGSFVTLLGVYEQGQARLASAQLNVEGGRTTNAAFPPGDCRGGEAS